MKRGRGRPRKHPGERTVQVLACVRPATKRWLLRQGPSLSATAADILDRAAAEAKRERRTG